MKITLQTGQTKLLKINKFGAMDGWQLQHEFGSFIRSKDKDLRMAYTMEILSYASIIQPNGDELPLQTNALVENHLQEWSNIKLVFEEVLRVNGIDPTTHAEDPKYWENAGASFAISFIATSTELLEPFLAQLTSDKG